MSNYNSAFSQIARSSDILVSNFNFGEYLLALKLKPSEWEDAYSEIITGCGSSREQVATVILAK